MQTRWRGSVLIRLLPGQEADIVLPRSRGLQPSSQMPTEMHCSTRVDARYSVFHAANPCGVTNTPHLFLEAATGEVSALSAHLVCWLIDWLPAFRPLLRQVRCSWVCLAHSINVAWLVIKMSSMIHLHPNVIWVCASVSDFKVDVEKIPSIVFKRNLI